MASTAITCACTQTIRRIKRLIPYYRAVHCPICGQYDHKFITHGAVPRPNARCTKCGSLERHRLVWVFFERHTDLFDQRPRSMLHIAPEWELSCKLKVQPNLRYVTADLNMPWVSVRFDINQLPHPDGGFDVVYCSHVLEHIPDDRRAMREICRVLKPGGWAVIIVPITTDVTFEDLSVTDPDERHRLFGQNDHVRRYGPDIENRLADSGFDVQVFQAADVVDEDEGRRLAIPFKSSPMYYCKRPA